MLKSILAFIMFDLKFLDRKINMLIMSGLREDLIGVTMFPAALNRRSDGVLVAQIHFKQPWPAEWNLL